ncbi:MAG TPA: hypothetical protein VGB13_07940, partial [Candidatus Krumholzibacteria bacterium]
EVVADLRALLEAAGGCWPDGFDRTAVDLIGTTLRVRGGRVEDRLRGYFLRHGGFAGTQTELAERIGCTREAVCRALAKLPVRHDLSYFAWEGPCTPTSSSLSS